MTSQRQAALALAEFLQARGEIDCAQIAIFYEQQPGMQSVVQAAKSRGSKPGPRALAAMNNDILAVRTSQQSNGHTRLFISAVEPSNLDDGLDGLSSNLASMDLAALELKLEALCDTSKTQFGKAMKAKGLCLKNFKVYGDQLPKQLSKHAAMRVNKDECVLAASRTARYVLTVVSLASAGQSCTRTSRSASSSRARAP